MRIIATVIVMFVGLVGIFVGCSSDKGPVFENSGVTESFQISTKKGYDLSATVSIIFDTSNQAAMEGLYQNVRPVITETITQQSYQWDAPPVNLMTGVNPDIIMYGGTFCRQVTKVAREKTGAEVKCILMKIERA